jgi:hypothetical protein
MARALKAVAPKEAKPSKPKILIFGKPGVGKTWAALDFPGVYYIDTEGGANLAHYTDKLKNSGGMYLGPNDGSNDFATVTEEIITLATTQHAFRTLVIDSYSKIFGTQVSIELERIQARQEAKGEAGKETYGAEKKPAVNWTRRWLRWFEKLDMNVILICHERDKYQDGKLQGVTFDGWDKLEYELHLALNIAKQGPSRKARVVKSRIQEFPDAEVFDWSYEAFSAKYGRAVIEAPTQAVEMSTPEQAKQYADLLAVVKVDPKILEKWEDNGGPEDLSKVDLQKRLDYLAKLLPKQQTPA